MNWNDKRTSLLRIIVSRIQAGRCKLIYYSVLCIMGIVANRPMIAQTISGTITNSKKEALPGARIVWENTSTGSESDSLGHFSIPGINNPNARLLISFPGYETDTLIPGEFQRFNISLRQPRTLEQITISAQKEGITISDSNPIKTEQITQTELSKSACCDMAVCFETQSTVQPQVTNVITQSKELRILGLSGVYNQILVNGLPMIQGLSYTYGISNIPGTLVDNIFVSKGANSVLQGYESISGQIAVETKDPDKGEVLLANIYINSFQEKHFNTNFSLRKNKWSNLIAFHSVQPAAKIDRDQDLFLDLPLLTRYGVMNKLKYGNENEKGFFTTLSLRYSFEERIGGQVQFNPIEHTGSSIQYGQVVQYHQPELMSKSGYRFSSKHALVWMLSGYIQNQDSWFGTVQYQAKQRNAYGNLQHEFTYGKHNLKSGLSFRHLLLTEDIRMNEMTPSRNYAGQYIRHENIPGVFSENTLNIWEDKITWITGIRADHHNVFGTQFTPRTLLKFTLYPKTILRLNAGTGWRTANIFSENIGLLISSRNIIFAEQLEPEKAVNSGINLTQKFEIQEQNYTGYISLDYYHTQFQNQIFPDYDANSTEAIIRNYRGISRSQGFQAEVKINFYQRLEVKTGYTWLYVYRENSSGRYELPFNTRNRWVNTVSYKPLSERFHLDLVFHHYGKQKLPNTQNNPVEYQRPNYSIPYTTVNIQLTLNAGRWEFYTGIENIADFRQRQPILSWQNPFGPWFDTSSVWGPTRGREAYAGIRYKIFQKEE